MRGLWTFGVPLVLPIPRMLATDRDSREELQPDGAEQSARNKRDERDERETPTVEICRGAVGWRSAATKAREWNQVALRRDPALVQFRRR